MKKQSALRVSSRKVESALKIHESEEHYQFESLKKAFHDHAIADQEAFKKFTDLLESIDKKIDPIVETYMTVGSLGKWAMVLLVAISLIVGIVWGIIQIIISHKTP